MGGFPTPSDNYSATTPRPRQRTTRPERAGGIPAFESHSQEESVTDRNDTHAQQAPPVPLPARFYVTVDAVAVGSQRPRQAH